MILRTTEMIYAIRIPYDRLPYVKRALLLSSAPHSGALIIPLKMTVFSYIIEEYQKVNAIIRVSFLKCLPHTCRFVK